MNSQTALATLLASPHAHDSLSVPRVMQHVCIALAPATLYGVYIYGWPALILFTLTCLAAVATEALCLWLQKKSISRITDCSALLTGWLLAMTLPPWAPWWIAVGGAAFAVAVGKHLYGGLGQNIFNPAMLARVALLVSFPVQMTTWVTPQPFGTPDFLTALDIVFNSAPITDGLTGASMLGELKASYDGHNVETVLENSYQFTSAFTGNTYGSLGETSELLILLGGAWLLFFRIISWHIPVAMLATTALLAMTFHTADSTANANAIIHLTSGGILLGAFFIATDYVTSPSSKIAQLIFGAGCGFVIYAIRAWGGFPEGVGFAVLFMNAFTPLLDRYCKPRVYGRTVSGNPLKSQFGKRS